MFKKLFFLFILVFLLFSTTGSIYAENDGNITTELDNSLDLNHVNNDLIEIKNSDNSGYNNYSSVVYVSNNGNDSSENGSFDNPFLTLSKAISSSNNGGIIYLFNDTYFGSANTNLIINKNLTISALYNNACLNGENKFYFFYIESNVNLYLNNITFTEGFSDSTTFAIIYNNGDLYINNSVFHNMNSFAGTIYNRKNLYIFNSNFYALESSQSYNLGGAIFNLENTYIYNSNFESSIYSTNNISLINTTVYTYRTKPVYESPYLYIKNDDLNKNINIFIDGCNLNDFRIEKSDVQIYNSELSSNTYHNAPFFDYCNILIDNTYFSNFGGSNYNSYGTVNVAGFSNSNVSIISSYFANNFFLSDSNIKISYSTILGSIVDFSGSFINASYNWWGWNKGISIVSDNFIADFWIIMTFDCEENPISVGTNAKFSVSLNKYTNGNDIYNLANLHLLYDAYVFLESENGYFLNTNGYLTNGTFSTYLINNSESIVVYAVIDSERLKLAIGSGSTNYAWYVSPDGNDSWDGTYDNPFKTLSFAASKSLNGNTIYLLNGTYYDDLNANLTITNNLTIIGIGDVIISKNINFIINFTIMEWGILNIDNVNFLGRSLIYLKGGVLNIKNTNFSNNNQSARATVSISASSGIYSNGHINIFNSSFKNISGNIISSSAPILISNSIFENIFTTVEHGYLSSSRYCIGSSSNVTIINSSFLSCEIGAVYVNRSGSSDDINNYVYIINSTFSDNWWERSPDIYLGYTSSDKTLYYGLHLISSYKNYYSIVENCNFSNNKGFLVLSSEIISSNFISNSLGEVVKCDFINNSYFFNNSNIVEIKNYYYGNGTVQANTVLNSVFINNKAAYGGAIFNPETVHYSVLYNNSAIYSGNDILLWDKNADYSSNWWGNNQKPNSERIYKFLGTITISNWIIMTLTSDGKIINASLSNLIDNDGNIISFSTVIPSRLAIFESEDVTISPEKVYLNNNIATSYLENNNLNYDFNVYATIDNQTIDLTIHNDNTEILMEDVIFYGNNNKYSINLINVNGHRIYNQTLVIRITTSNGQYYSFSLNTNEYGVADFLVDYAIGVYSIEVFYSGDGYFKSSNNTKTITILKSLTYTTSYDFAFNGRNNNFYAVLTDVNNIGIANETIKFNITNSEGNSITAYAITNIHGRADIILSLDLGTYMIYCEYMGSSWYDSSYSNSKITISPANSTIMAQNVTLFGIGNLYNITLIDSYGTSIKDAIILLTISQTNQSKTYELKTNDKGIASITINLAVGQYNISAVYEGDGVYRSAKTLAYLNIEEVSTIINGFYHTVIPLNGIYTIVLTDMFGKYIVNANVTLDLYKGVSLIKTLWGLTDGKGEINFIIDLEVGNYLGLLNYYGDEWYKGSNSGCTIIVNETVSLGNVLIDGSDLIQFYGENLYYKIYLNDPNSFSLYGKTVMVTISSNTWSENYELLTDVYGFGRIQIILEPGNYNITYKYLNDFYGLFATKTNTIIVYAMPSYISASSMIINKGEARYFEITLKDINGNYITNLPIQIEINGQIYNISTNSFGIAKLLIDLDFGEYLVKYSFNNQNYISSTGNATILIVDSDKISTILSGTDIDCFDNDSFNFTLKLSDLVGNGISSAEIMINILTLDNIFINKYTSTTNSDGIVVFNFDLEYGNYIIYGYFEGNNNYLASYSSNFIKVDSSSNKTRTVLNPINLNLNSFNNELFGVVLFDREGNVLTNQEIIFQYNNKTYSTFTDSNGIAYLNLTLDAGIHSIYVLFNENENYTKASLSLRVTASGNLTYLISNDLIKYYLNNSQFVILILYADGSPIINKTISFTINNQTYNRTTNSSGHAKLSINLVPGDYEILTAYYSSDSRENAYKINYIRVLPTLLANNTIKYYLNDTHYFVKVLDWDGSPIANINTTININGVFYIRTTNSEGIAKLSINLYPGTYVLTVTHPNDGLKISNYIQVLPTIIANNLEKYYKNDSQFEAKLIDGEGNLLINKTVTMNINGVFYNRTTNNQGIVRLSINLNPAEYIITVINPLDNLFWSFKINVKPTLEGNDLTMNHLDGNSYTVRLIDDEGKALTNQNITLNINGVFYNRLTDENGIARLTINLDPNHYIITSTYNGYSTSNIVVVNQL